jgi:hypothetical protein
MNEYRLGKGSRMVLITVIAIVLAAAVFIEVYRQLNRRWGENP